MDTEQRLLELFDGINFKIVNGDNSVEQFKKIARYNQEQYDLIEARGELYEERLLDMISLVLAEKLHPIAMDRYGDTGEISVRRIFDETTSNPTTMSDLRKVKQLALSTISADDFNESQVSLLSELLDLIPEMILDFIVQLAGRLEVIPMTELSGITRILTLMMQEEGYADNTRNN